MSTAEPPSKPGWWQRAARLLGFLALGLTLLALTMWASAALYFDVRVSWLRGPLAVGYLLALVAVWVFTKRRWLAVSLTASGFALVVSWWFMLQPSNQGDWRPDLAVLAYADIEGTKVKLHNIRNCDYRSETDYDVHYYDKTVDLDKIRTTDFYMVYWGAPYMAHTMVSFGFEGGEFICFSIETRNKKGQGYSAVKGLFRQFELIHVLADERDVVRLRTNYRQGEEVYLFRLRVTPEQSRKFFLDYVRSLNELQQRPAWYSALTDNCTTGIRAQRAAADRMPWDWRILANGYGDELLYERGIISTNLPLAELKEKCHINARARAADTNADFSRVIRQGVAGIDL